MSLRRRLEELEELPPGCDFLDVDLLLRGCGYECYDDGVTLLYSHEKWRSIWTFPRSRRSIPASRLLEIIAFVRWHLEREGRLDQEYPKNAH
jgi:hypothetical protein